MPGIFISHASIDKPIVRRIAAELLLERIPVWLDQWELNIGDALDSSLTNAIGKADYSAVFISRASIASGWVNREISLALEYERRLGRVFLLPVLLEDVPPPLQIAERIYADVSTPERNGISSLVRRVKNEGVGNSDLPYDKAIYPLLFLEDSISINQTRMSEYLSWMNSLYGSSSISRKVVAINTIQLDALTQTVTRTLVQARTQIDKGHEQIEELIRNIQESADLMVQGAEYILTNMAPSRSHDAAVTLAWFARLVQARLIQMVGSAVLDNDTRLAKLRDKFSLGSSDEFFASFYDCKKVRKLDFWDDSTRPIRSVSAYVDASESIMQTLEPPFNCWREMCDDADSVLLGPKYLIPIQVLNWFGAKKWARKLPEVYFDFARWSVGLS